MKSLKNYFSVAINEGSAGIINGLILCIYSFTFGSLLVSHHGNNLLGVAIGSMLIGGMFGSLYGVGSKDKALTCGPSGGAASIMAGPALIFFGGANLNAGMLMLPIVLLGLLVALAFYCLARFGAHHLFKFIPYSVFVGLMAASGYLIAKGGMAIIFGSSFQDTSIASLLHYLGRPEIFSGIFIGLLFTILAPRVSAQILIPGIIFISSLLINIYLKSDFFPDELHDSGRWFFSINTNINWLSSWDIDYQGLTVIKFLEFLPTVLSIAFICVLSILVSFENLYIWFSEEFDSEVELRNHSILIGVSALFGGFISTLAFQRVILNKKIGATLWGGTITSLIAIIAFWHIDLMVKLIPSCVIGGFLLYQGIEIIQKSFSNRKNLTKIDLFLALLILLLVALHSFVYGFIVGLLLSFLYSLYSLSRIPLIDKSGDLVDFRSSVIRPYEHDLILRKLGERVKYFRLEGYLFYGTVTQLDSILSSLDFDTIDGVVIDAMKVSGFDTSAKISLGRILARHHKKSFKWYFAANTKFSDALKNVLPNDGAHENTPLFYDNLNLALEVIEGQILLSNNISMTSDCLQFLSNEKQKRKFLNYCKKITLNKGESFTCKPTGPQEYYFMYDGECTIEAIGSAGRIVLSRVFTGAFVGEASYYLNDDSRVTMVAQIDSVILDLPLEGIVSMSEADPDLYSLLNKYLIQVLSDYLLHAKKFINLQS